MTNLSHKRKVVRDCVDRWNEGRKKAGFKTKSFWLSPKTLDLFSKVKKASGRTNNEILEEAIEVLAKRWKV